MLVKKHPCFEEFQLLAESLPQLVWTKNPEGDQVFLNKRWEEYTGASLDGKWDWTSMLHEDDYMATVSAWKESLRTGNFFEIESRIKRSDGMYRWHLIRAIPAIDDEGAIINWIGTCTDIHESRTYENTLKKKNTELQKINKDLDNFDQ